ncbi:MAG: histidinol dehydrogenase [Candidatus Methanogaster sp.]|uniref:Histidinol dehydrogenase n=1 Tax=Candidatus Methanogaster sp. TaxID=3386292 RepID=A0AC61L5Q5_9EURY|nr:MAG: histidinol dehydrogenase [ANME-2 cluster archaeon]
MLKKHHTQLTDSELESLLDRETGIAKVKPAVSAILEDVKTRGDAALIEYTHRFDNVSLSAIEVEGNFISEAFEEVDSEILWHLETAADNIRRFHEAQLEPELWLSEITPGISLGQKTSPLDCIGAYVPGGKAAYPSTALMTIIPAKVASVPEAVICTPPMPGGDGSVNPLTLAAAVIAGADRVFAVGGAQAIAAMAYGTETVPAVDRIVGPGNVYVTAAKMLVSTRIDFPAGPSEVLIIADESANPDFIAADMVAQAEHDSNAVSILVTTSEAVAGEVFELVGSRSADAVRSEIIEKSLEHGAILVFDSIDECTRFSNTFAPEHLEIMVENPLDVLNSVYNAGSIFVGDYAPVPAGDYASGTNHVLPTAGHAWTYSGLNVSYFTKKSSIQIISKEGLSQIRDTVVAIADEEGLKSHADAIKARFSDEEDHQVFMDV